MSERRADAYRFGDFTLDLSRCALFQGSAEVKLRPRTFDVLTFLVRNSGRVVTKAELIAAVWGDVAVTDDSLVQSLVEIRKALGGSDIVRTVRGRGYLFDAAVTNGPAGAAANVTLATTSPPAARPAFRTWQWAGAAGALLAVTIAVWLASSGDRPRSPGRSAPPPSPVEQAYAAGRAEYERRSRSGLRRAVDHFEGALAIDPLHTPAYVGLADALTLYGVFGAAPPIELGSRAGAAARRAVELDPTSAEAWTALGHTLVQHDWDWPGAEAAYKRALALNPKSARAHGLYSLLLAALGRCRESRQLDELAREIDGRPRGGIPLYLCRSTNEAEQALTARAGAQPDSIAKFWLALAYLELGRHDDAMVAALASRDEIGNAPTWIVGYAHARSGRRSDALEVKRAIEAQARTMYVPATELAFLAIGLGEDDEALNWLDRGFDERSHWMELLAVHPVLDPLRDEPRFAELLRRMKLPSDAWRP
jgi:DNA-binding winged helix-turn-helix (wHTH) protein/tetratricopeptide (TPR) repeat protein